MSLSHVSLLVLLAAGCGESSREVQVWSADEHQAPSQPAAEDTGAVATHDPADAPNPEELARLATAVFARECASCHGAGGAGDGANAPTAMPDMTTSDFHAARSDADLTRVIRMGNGLMPAFGNRFNEQGIVLLVAHIRGLRPTPDSE